MLHDSVTDYIQINDTCINILSTFNKKIFYQNSSTSLKGEENLLQCVTLSYYK